MFSSPNIHISNHENAEGLLVRKPGLNHMSTRKALQDRIVNKERSPNTLRSNANAFRDLKQTVPKSKSSPNWLLDVCSGKDVEDNYEDILPAEDRLSKRDINYALKGFLGKNKKRKEKIVVDVQCPVEVDPLVFEVPIMNELVFNCAEVVEDVPLPDVEGFD